MTQPVLDGGGDFAQPGQQRFASSATSRPVQGGGDRSQCVEQPHLGGVCEARSIDLLGRDAGGVRAPFFPADPAWPSWSGLTADASTDATWPVSATTR